MTEVARFFDGVLYSEGDQAEVQARWARDGVCIGVGSELLVSGGGAGLASVASGEAFVQGFWYKNTAAKPLAITSNVSGTARVDLVVLHLDRVSNSLEAVIHEGVIGGGTPELTQIVGGTWELPLASISTISGVSTITDARQWQSNMFNPMTTQGDIIVADSAGRPVRKAKGVPYSLFGVDASGNVAYQYAVPIGTVCDFTGPTAPAGWVFLHGQLLSRSLFSGLFAVIGTTYGVGDGITTFGVPDCRGRTTVGKDNMGGTSANRMITNIAGGTLGAAGGAESHTLTVAQMPSHGHVYDTARDVRADTLGNSTVKSTNAPVSTNTTQGAGGDAAHNNTQPGIILNKIMFAGA